MSLDVMFTDDPARVIDRAGAFLMTEPCLHNVILTLLHARTVHPVPGRYWVASRAARSMTRAGSSVSSTSRLIPLAPVSYTHLTLPTTPYV